MKEGIVVTDREKCTNCGECAGVCCFKTRELSGRICSSEQICDEIIKDEVVYRNTGGGITFSSGEPLLYPEFVYHNNGIRIIPRIPLVPGINDGSKEFSGILNICED